MSEASAEERKEYARLYNLLIVPTNVRLSRVEGGAWLSDQHMTIDVSGSPVIQGLEDGWYRIVYGGKEPGFRDRGPGLGADIAKYLKEWRKLDFHPVTPTELSITDDQAKSFLLIVEVSSAARYEGSIRLPVAMNEDVWKEFRKVWPQAEIRHSGHSGPFRVSIPGCPELAYIQPSHVPQHLQKVFGCIADAYVPPGADDG